jgi:PBP1b-binding outer membrane lipoprotein LpoB
MKKMMFIGVFALLAAGCAEQATEEETSQTESTENVVSEKDLKELEEEQAVNIELEQLDGELDSLLNTL